MSHALSSKPKCLATIERPRAGDRSFKVPHLQAAIGPVEYLKVELRPLRRAAAVERKIAERALRRPVDAFAIRFHPLAHPRQALHDGVGKNALGRGADV